MALPSATTVHIPHMPRSQPYFVPVRSSCSRSRYSSVQFGWTLSDCATPLTVSVRGMPPLAGVGATAWGTVVGCGFGVGCGCAAAAGAAVGALVGAGAAVG